MQESDLDLIVEEVIRTTDKNDVTEIAEAVASALLSRPKREARPLVAEAAMPRVLRHLRRLAAEEDDLVDYGDPYDPRLNNEIVEPSDYDTPHDMPKELRPFVEKTVRIPGAGLVRWGDVTLEQHLERVRWIETKVGGLSKAKQKHQESIRYCRKYYANTLYEAIDKANGDKR